MTSQTPEETHNTREVEETLSNIEDIIQNYHGNWPDEDEMGEILGELRKLEDRLHHQLQSIHTSLVEAVEGMKEDGDTPFGTQELHETELAYNAVEKILHQQLQKAREEAVTRAMDEMLEYTHLGEQFIDGVRTLIEARGIKLSANHSELDQDKK